MRMNTKSRSFVLAKTYCLLCCSKITCKNGGDGDGGIEIDGGIIGAARCFELEGQLKRMFILLKVLDVPASWCGELLGRGGGGGNLEGEGGGPRSWFNVCGDCVGGGVNKAWRIHQQLLQLQGKMGEIKERMREGMRRGIVEERRNLWCGDREGTPSFEIKRLLFPELFLKCEDAINDDHFESFECEATLGGASDDDGDDPTFQLNVDYQNRNDFLTNELQDFQEDSQLMESPKRRGRGRPPKVKTQEPDDLKIEQDGLGLPTMGGEDFPNLPNQLKEFKEECKTGAFRKRGRGRPCKKFKKPGFRQPLYYYDRHWGTLRKKKFHWKVCRECGSRFKTQEEYDAHEKAHEKNGGKGEFDCSQCSFPGRDAQELEFHVRRRHTKKPGRRKYKCTRCGFEAEIWKILKEHVEREHPSVASEELGNEINLKCDICGKQMKSMQALSRHRNDFHGGGEDIGGIVECLECKIKFPSERHLRSHVDNVHKRRARFVCDECGMGFEFQCRLESHRLRHLEDDKKRDFVCHLCGLDYYDEKRLKGHIWKSHEKKGSASGSSGGGEVFKCRFCEVTSPFKMVIKRHLELHKEALGHECGECGRKYTNAQGLRRHVKFVHSGGGPWNCGFCGKEFPCEEYMKDHVKRFCKVKRVQGEGGGVGASTSMEVRTETQEFVVPLIIEDCKFEVNL